MARATFNGLSLEIPDGWSDESTIMLTAPLPDDPNLPTVSQVSQGLTPNIVLRREPHDGGDEILEQIAAHQEDEITALPGGRVADRSTLTMTMGGEEVTALCREFVLPSPAMTPAQQLHLYFVKGRHVHIFIGTALVGDDFKRLRQQFVDIANSIELR
ncbi:hypothetical protein ACFL6C_11245 [Myxococcota bacterium]